VELINRTPFTALHFVVPDRDGAETAVVVLKATWTVRGEACERAERQDPIVLADEFYGDPASSSVRLESELCWHKPATDVVLLGHAHAPHAGARESVAALKVGPLVSSVRVFGDRSFGQTLGISRVKGPEPFERIPLRWEHAFGGMQKDGQGEDVIGAEERNPVGRGYVRKKRKSHVDGLALPNLEDPRRLLKRPCQTPAPVGFGFVARHWQPRRTLFGTHDAAWQEDRMPLLPEDFDERAFCGAPAGLQATPFLVGGEPVEILGATPSGVLRFELPRVAPTFELHEDGHWHGLDVALDTVVIDADAGRVTTTWRAHRNVHGRIRKLRAVRVACP
jgi:hypothetical protein